MFISKKKDKEKKTHIYRTFTARARTCGCAVDLPDVWLFRVSSLTIIIVNVVLTYFVNGILI